MRRRVLATATEFVQQAETDKVEKCFKETEHEHEGQDWGRSIASGGSLFYPIARARSKNVGSIYVL